MRRQWATWANLLTTLRLCCIPAVYLAISASDWLIAACLFALAAISDYFDGKLARYFKQANPLGGLFDHTTDALFVTVCCAALAQLNLSNPWLPLLIPAAFVQYMLDSRALAGQPLRTSLLGRYNGIAYFVLAGVAIGAGLLSWSWLLAAVPALSWVLCATTVLSMFDRLMLLLRLRRRSGT